uniref:Uncharacterized protein n=1 Tax=Phasianus colchicus TaxID=9054 RepID=A0A669Q805_PHACC
RDCCQHLPMPTSHPEVLGVHVQLVTVQLRQLGVGVLDVVQVLHGFPKGAQHFLTMSTDPGVTNDGGGAGKVPKRGKKPLGPGVDNQQPAEGHKHTPLTPPPKTGPRGFLLHRSPEEGRLKLDTAKHFLSQRVLLMQWHSCLWWWWSQHPWRCSRAIGMWH